MAEIRVELGERSYRIVIGSGILGKIGEQARDFGFSKRIGLVSNPVVHRLYGKAVEDSLRDAGFDVITILVPDGEEYKSLTWASNIYGELLKHRLDRASALIALGGGVIGDITGFVASTYMRGISFLQVPTTLLAQVDSSVGGKTGVNHPLGKNMIGTFYQPRLVWADIDTMKTLPRRELLAGMAEVIKYGIIRDEDFFAFLEKSWDSILDLEPSSLIHIIRRSCEIKADVVSKDERESGLRAILNYGHTIGHAVETVTGYTAYLHGEAVAIGMSIEARLSVLLNLAVNSDIKRIKSLLALYNLPYELPAGISKDSLLSAMKIDKKALAGEMRFVLPEKIGAMRVEKVSADKVSEVLM